MFRVPNGRALSFIKTAAERFSHLASLRTSASAESSELHNRMAAAHKNLSFRNMQVTTEGDE
ncbi:hypothetical protein M569_02769 [Genlisea aurea]|uniref:Uncharacterized protein n=1 Tax=Genlisea aurea TaxID=192259 RepID=S8CX62_9LAMI|nr:hypothetical protein M569_02769 [Genlisea aurea]